VFVIDVWEKPDRDPDWTVDRTAVDLAVDRMMDTYQVQRLECDPMGWASELEKWVERYGDDIVLALPNTRQRMAPACSRFYTAVVQGDLTHDGDVRLARHIGNAAVKETVDGAYITKDGRSSPRKIDLAVAAVIAYDARSRVTEVYEPQVVLI
jgi:phage terminase large subunit-like protein